MKEIPQFTQDEVMDLRAVFEEERIPYDCKGIIITTGFTGGITGYNFWVGDEYYQKSIRLIKAYFGFPMGTQELYSGICPACQFQTSNVSECPDCGLSLVASLNPSIKQHSFYIYLEQQNLLND